MIRIIFTILGVALAGFVFFFYTKPTYDRVRTVQTQVAQYDTALTKATELQELKQTLLSRYNAFNPSDIDRLQKFLPDHVDNVRLILDLDSLASRYGLGLQNVDVTGTSGASGRKEQTALGAIAAGSQKYDSLTLKFTTRGSYDSFVSFMTDLESSLRVVDLVNLTVSRDTSAAASSVATPGALSYTYDVTIRTYWLK